MLRKNQINNSQQLYLDLMSKSPYLSDTVLKSSAVKEEVLTDMLIRDVMVSNPQSAKEDEVIQKLEERDEPLPDYMMDQIMAGLDSIGAQEILKRELAGHRTRRQSAYRDLHRIFKTDTALGGSDSLMNLLQEVRPLMPSTNWPSCTWTGRNMARRKAW